ncbi:MAG TPA: putative peptidoglycan glycosyltransferase FtsW [Ignavibacteriaceae bacterium]|nr:putative peptidoglycan glycosyltransferase FtsW [Ignavibacteriaceae bacterium]
MKKLAIIVFFTSFSLILIGLIVVMSASSTYSSLKFDSAFHLFQSHLFRAGFGLLMMGVFCIIPYETYKSLSKIALIAITVVLIYTLLFAPQVKGAGRWLNLGFITIQPADIARLLLIIHLANLISLKQDDIKDFKNGFMYLLIWILIIAGLIFLQPNVSNAVLVVVVSLTMLYVGGAQFKHIFASSFSLLLMGGSVAMIFSHSRARILGFINSFSNGGDINMQVKQAIYGLGSGGILGVGIGNSKQNNLFLPEAYGDFIFAILGEETGFVGVITVLVFYLILFVAGILIAKKAKDKFGQMLAFGISFSIIINAFVNAAVATGLFPTTGLPLPFISYGGTSIIFVSASIGILLNIAILNNKNIKEKETKIENVPALEEIR